MAKTIFATAITANLLISTTVTAGVNQPTNQVFSQTNNSIIDDVTKIMSSPAAFKAYAKIKFVLLKKLQTTKMPRKEDSAVFDFITFVSKNQAIFAKWQSISTDFAQEIINTMSIEDILNNIGLTKEMIEPAVCQSAEAAIAEEKAKNDVITKILQHSAGALTGIITSLGIGWSTITEYIGARAKNVEDLHSVNENPVQAALRKALKKNLTLPQLQALFVFSQTPAFNAIASSFDEVKTIFFQTLSEEDPTSLAKIAARLQTLQTDSDGIEAMLASNIAKMNITTPSARA